MDLRVQTEDDLIIKLRQHRIIQVCGLRSKIFRQNVQIIGRHTDVWVPIFGQSDGTRFKQGVRLELCGGALIILWLFNPFYQRVRSVFAKSLRFALSEN